MGLFRRNTNRDAEAMLAALKQVAPDVDVSIAIVDGQACVSLPAKSAEFSYLIPRKGVWGLFEGLSNQATWDMMPPTTVVVGRLSDDSKDVARRALEWHAKSRLEKYR